MIFASIMNVRLIEYVERFCENNTFDPNRAVFLWEIGIPKNIVVHRMMRGGVLAKMADNRYYLLKRYVQFLEI